MTKEELNAQEKEGEALHLIKIKKFPKLCCRRMTDLRLRQRTNELLFRAVGG